jgi:hypothetical protein
MYQSWALSRLNNVPDYRFVEGCHTKMTVNPARSGNPAR